MTDEDTDTAIVVYEFELAVGLLDGELGTETTTTAIQRAREDGGRATAHVVCSFHMCFFRSFPPSRVGRLADGRGSRALAGLQGYARRQDYVAPGP